MKKAFGFTLVELSVVLVIVGIIMGMAIKGRDLIETSRLRKELRKLDKFAAAAAVSYTTNRELPGDLYISGQEEGYLTEDDLEVNSYFNNSADCLTNSCVWRFIRAVAVYNTDNTTYYRSPEAADGENGDVLLAVATDKTDAAKNGYANSFVCKVEEYIDDKNFKGGMGLFFNSNSAADNYTNDCSPSKNLLSGAHIPYGYKVF
ncbi:MAG: prepilin-type N-terminal cleavage/methylation domain-containing protein [Deferribacteraceae bacterium]|jgi:prepilin-type N-terminal cleavage/methylation domain-containing protein|nr:prepilin-type N-terminal cleavage/methylation domain-containing protein [Deferribacteraceae bacterium]